MLGQILEPIQISDMLAAKQRLRKEFPPSPLLSIAPLDQELGTPVYLKAENLLPSAAYKFRGATNKIKTLIETSGTEVRIITASSGNHGMACALAASRLGIPATVANEFCKRAQAYDLLFPPTDDFACPGWCRIAFCTTTEQVEKALPIFEKLAKEYGL